MSKEFFKKFNFMSGVYEIAANMVGGEQVAYISLPYRGCTKDPRCKFCGVQEFKNPDLVIDRAYGDEVLYVVSNLVDQYNPTNAVLFNGGNILRPEEMYQQTILSDIPEFIREHQTCKYLEIEVRIDDVKKMRDSLNMIQENLGEKKLRVRLGIEFFSDRWLNWHGKGTTISQILEAVSVLNDMSIAWNGYVLLGGLEMKREEVVNSAINTAEFIMAAGGFKISFNGLFLTKLLVKEYGLEAVYIPSWDDLIEVLSAVTAYRQKHNYQAILKVGYSEEDESTMLRQPYISHDRPAREVKTRLREFNATQGIAVLLDE